jgi:hypothetical protein
VGNWPAPGRGGGGTRAKVASRLRSHPSSSLARQMLRSPGMRLPHRLIIVRRGEAGIYQAIQDNLDRWPKGTRVIWDRRERDRRVMIRPVTLERRQSERRTAPDSMWYTHGFIVVEAIQPPADLATEAS